MSWLPLCKALRHKEGLAEAKFTIYQHERQSQPTFQQYTLPVLSEPLDPMKSICTAMTGSWPKPWQGTRSPLSCKAYLFATAPWGSRRQQTSTALAEDAPPTPILHNDLMRMVDEARGRSIRRLGTARPGTPEYTYQYRSTLRGWSRILAGVVRRRDRDKGRQSDVDHEHILDLVLEQYGCCAYSGMPLQLLRPNSHCRASLERIDNREGYVKGNCCLIAAEFNSAVRKYGAKPGSNMGSAQWSKLKVRNVADVRRQPVQLDRLREDIMVARLRPPSNGSKSLDAPRCPDSQSRFLCGRCLSWKPENQFWSASSLRDNLRGVRRNCKSCESDAATSYRSTMRGHAVGMISTARRRDSKAQCSGSFGLDLQSVFDMLWQQGGRCYYSGVPLHCAQGPADWVWSIERLENSVTYTKNNCVLIAQEFNTSDHSRNTATHEVFGTAQWSRSKASHVWGPYYHDA